MLYFIQYWGASHKDSLDKYDYESLFNLFGLLRVIEKQYKMEVHLTVIFTDSHVLLNGYKQEIFKKYYKELKTILNEFNYSHILMSEILMPFIRQHRMKDINELIISIIDRSKINEVSTYVQNNHSFELLKNSASKHSYRYSNNQIFGDLRFDTTEQSAYAYIELNQLEKHFVEKNYSQSVFLTYTSDDEKELIAPNLPSLQIYSFRKGIRSRPWFSYFNKEEKK
ncbi:MAG: hypothetical protein IPQ10_00040 [Saprospiraceae bacterium]|nr:hypothetical protein [Saprospiraceae bacterium]